jgi:hypothetical protein
MTRNQCKIVLPVIMAYIEGKHLQYYDAINLHGNYRGWWTTPSEGMGVGFLTNLALYRIKNPDGSFEYFSKESEKYSQRDFDTFQVID